jgi:hypothetical protein
MAMDKKKLGKLAMPKKRREEEDFEMAAEAGDEPEAMPELGPDETDAMEGDLEMDMGEEAAPNLDLEGLSDDDLLAEVKKRGLMAQLSKEEPEEDNSIYA